jgi:hypothetical protein
MELDSKDSEPYYIRGCAYREHGNYKQALKENKIALSDLIGFQGKRTGDTGIRYPEVSCHLRPMICW